MTDVDTAPLRPADRDVPFEPFLDEYGVLMWRPETETVPETEDHVRHVDIFHAGFRELYGSDPDVAVHSRLAWFLDADDTRIRHDPDIMIVRGRAHASRTSYKAWAEAGVSPELVVEIMSSGDTSTDYRRRLARMFAHGLVEAVLVDPLAPGGVEVHHYVLDPAAADGYRTAAVSVAPDSPIKLPRHAISIAGGPDLVVTGEDGIWLDMPGRIRAAAADRARADAAAARAERLAAALRHAGIDPDAIR